MSAGVWRLLTIGSGLALAAGALFVIAVDRRPGQSPPIATRQPSPIETLYDVHCGICHLERGTGTLTLARRYGPDHALLAERVDLDANMIKQAVRAGVGSMPPQTRVDLSDAELDQIAGYLTRPTSERHSP
jgi:mono/diheme cytochrome c family protein